MITADIESFERALPELSKRFPQHWEELALFKDRMPLVPQFDEYIARERNGSLFLTVVRKNGEIVGYYTVQVAPGFHYGHTLTAHMDCTKSATHFTNKVCQGSITARHWASRPRWHCMSHRRVCGKIPSVAVEPFGITFSR